jgi:2-C-methyl-D-erythritol 4-phosphate cytidylyltransferase/2-C-methyl-D-erythritol 2,4-cyclodiphosphate synthase
VPKQYVRIEGAPVLTRTLSVFLDHPGIDLVQIAIGVGDEPLYASAVASLGSGRLLAPIHGGATRQASVRNGLRALALHAPDRVLIHDAARPFVTHDVIERVLAALGGSSGALAAGPVTDTL